MSSINKKNLNLLKIVASIKNRSLREEVLGELSNSRPSLLYTLKKLASHLIKNIGKLDAKEAQTVKRHKKGLLFVKNFNKKVCRKTTIEQTGGFIPYLIPIIIDLLTSL